MRRTSDLALLLLLAAPGPLGADEGMWTFNDFPRAKVEQSHGFLATDGWLDDVRLSALKFGGGCSASFVSANGLVMTNHHCARSCIQSLSSAQKDYSRDGFNARTAAEELRCPGLEVRELVGVENVTPRIDAATRGQDPQKWNEARKAEMARIEKACTDDAKSVECDVVTLWNGGRYDLYRYRKYDDVRLVFAPEAAIAFFGGDPDNFNFPRYDLDVSFLRAYDRGKPAATPHHYGWSEAGVKEGDLVFVVGHPGSTDRLNTVAELELARDAVLPLLIRMNAELRGLLTEFGRRGPEQRRMAETLLFGVENNLKRMGGMHEALLDRAFFERKRAAEAAVRARIAKDRRLRKLYGGAWDAVAKAESDYRSVLKPYLFIEGGRGFQSILFHFARLLVRAGDERPKPNDERLRELRDSALPSLAHMLSAPQPVYKELEELTLGFSLGKLREQLGADHPFVKKALGKLAPEELAHALCAGSKLDDPAVRRKLWEGGKAAVDASTDPMIAFARALDADARALRKRHDDEIDAPVKKNEELIARALFELFGTSTYPDATGTLRVTYGTVRGYQENGRTISPITAFRGAFDRATGREPFALPKSWLDAGGRVALDAQLDFASDTDIIGGNSGSPVINRSAEVVGVAFDGNIQSLGGAFYFDPAVNRTVSVSSAGILEALRAIYRADRLADEIAPRHTAELRPPARRAASRADGPPEPVSPAWSRRRR